MERTTRAAIAARPTPPSGGDGGGTTPPRRGGRGGSRLCDPAATVRGMRGARLAAVRGRECPPAAAQARPGAPGPGKPPDRGGHTEPDGVPRSGGAPSGVLAGRATGWPPRRGSHTSLANRATPDRPGQSPGRLRVRPQPVGSGGGPGLRPGAFGAGGRQGGGRAATAGTAPGGPRRRAPEPRPRPAAGTDAGGRDAGEGEGRAGGGPHRGRARPRPAGTLRVLRYGPRRRPDTTERAVFGPRPTGSP